MNKFLWIKKFIPLENKERENCRRKGYEHNVVKRDEIYIDQLKIELMYYRRDPGEHELISHYIPSIRIPFYDHCDRLCVFDCRVYRGDQCVVRTGGDRTFTNDIRLQHDIISIIDIVQTRVRNIDHEKDLFYKSWK